MELLDVYGDDGKVTGRVVVRGDKNEKFSSNEHIGVAIIYIENSNGEFLIQKTSIDKGGDYSSTGGHILHGEDADDTIKREVMEELGIDISNDNIVSLGYVIFDFPVRYIYYLKKDIDIDSLILQKEEVDFVEYMSIDKIRDIVSKGLMNKAHAKCLDIVLKYRSDR